MDWATLDTELPVLFAELLEIPCDWRKKARPMHTSARAQLDIVSNASVGIDEVAWAELDEEPEGSPDGEPESVQATVHGTRELVLQVSVWSPSQSLAASARSHLEELRTRLYLPSTLERIKALELALVNVEDLVLLDPTEDGREVSEAAVDVRLAYGHSATDAAIPFIETARIQSASARDAAGTVLGSSVQIDINPPEP